MLIICNITRTLQQPLRCTDKGFPVLDCSFLLTFQRSVVSESTALCCSFGNVTLRHRLPLVLQWLDLSKLLSRGMFVNVGSLPIMRKKLLMSYLWLSLCTELQHLCTWQNCSQYLSLSAIHRMNDYSGETFSQSYTCPYSTIIFHLKTQITDTVVHTDFIQRVIEQFGLRTKEFF